MLTGPQLGARHSRRLKGWGRMTGDVTKTGHILADEIGVSPSLGPNIPNVSVPYGALVPDSVDNMLVAGGISRAMPRPTPSCAKSRNAG